MTGTPVVDILLATWNGAQYLPEQIDSLLAQSCADWHLLARDDGSTDGTVDILKRYATAHPERITIVEDGDTGLGVCGNFARLMEHSNADYVMFCDQDDVWLPAKMQIMLDAMQRVERSSAEKTPILLHSDLKVVDRDLAEIHGSFWRYQRLDPESAQRPGGLLVQNVAVGCASVANRALVDMATPVPAEARMHDWWTALVASKVGIVQHLPEALVLYRQHQGNVIGATGWSFGGALRNIVMNPLRLAGHSRGVLQGSHRQAQALLRRHGDRIPADARRAVEIYASLPDMGVFERRRAFFRHGFLMDSTIKNLGILLFA